MLKEIEKYLKILFNLFMELSEENKSQLSLFTVAEVAELLKMNSQVIARKLHAGELEGYKLGKEWRVSEQQLLQYLDRHKNSRAKKDQSTKTIQTFFKEGKLTEIPASLSKRIHVLKHLVSQLDETKVYSEKEINAFIKNFHSDTCTIRREFVGNRLMVRKDGRYKRTSWNT